MHALFAHFLSRQTHRAMKMEQGVYNDLYTTVYPAMYKQIAMGRTTVVVDYLLEDTCEHLIALGYTLSMTKNAYGPVTIDWANVDEEDKVINKPEPTNAQLAAHSVIPMSPLVKKPGPIPLIPKNTQMLQPDANGRPIVPPAPTYIPIHNL